MKKTITPTVSSIAFLVAITLTFATQAQVNLLDPLHSPDTNPLLSTTGPNTVGKGHLQLSGAATWYSFSQNREVYPSIIGVDSKNTTVMAHDFSHELGGDIGLRYGLGSRFELMASVCGARNEYRYEFSSGTYSDTGHLLTPSLGLKVMLYRGEDWVPQLSAFARIDVPMARFGDKWDVLGNGAEPVLGLLFRNRLGKRWTLDYGLSYRFKERLVGNAVYVAQRDKPFQFDIMARWLANDRLLVSFGMENLGGKAEVMWQATPTLQLKAQGGFAAGFGMNQGVMETNALVGVNWMLQ